MTAEIYLNGENHNSISLDGTLAEFMQGSVGSTLVMKGGKNHKKLANLFDEIREGEQRKMMKGVINGSVCIIEENTETETMYFPNPIRVHII